eukprot:633442-Rhodomonas_salina.2
MQGVVFNHDYEYPFLNPSYLVTPGILSDDQVVEMHKTDLSLRTGEWMDEEALLQLQTQPAKTIASDTNEEEVQRTHPVTKPLLGTAKSLWDPTLSLDNITITCDTSEQRQLRKLVRDTKV